MQASHQKTFIFFLLALFVAYCGLVVGPNIGNLHIIGFQVEPSDERFLISGVLDGSPAEVAGLQKGDMIIAQDGRPSDDWLQLYRNSFSDYLEARTRLKGRDTTLRLLREEQTLSLTLTPRALSGVDFLRLYGVRITLVVLILGLAVFVATFSTETNSVFLFCLCFCSTLFWLISDTPYWPWFFSPLISSFPTTRFYIAELVPLAALQLLLSTLLHIVLTFPSTPAWLNKHIWIFILIHALPLMLLALLLFSPPGEFIEQITSVHYQRRWMNSGLLAASSLIMLRRYLKSRSAIHREQIRWIIVALVIVAVYHIGTWNLPLLFLNKPLVPNYDWILVVVALVPIAMTFSIANHRLFGLRGLVRGRIYMLERLLERERRLVVKRDSYIAELVGETEQLKRELTDYIENEFPSEKPTSRQRPILDRLETKYPRLKQLREEKLIGQSPCWEKVFEEAALAAQGSSPVLIIGESGTGKTDIAWAVHHMSERRDQVYRELSCAQFEHGDPAFALGKFFGIGANHGLANVPKEGQSGILEECDGGTLFLDDIDRLPLNVQDLLLYPLEGKPFEPAVGAGSARTVSIKYLFATNRQADQLAAEGRFQKDVLARISARVHLPPLRERPEDIPLLVDHYCAKIAGDYQYEISMISPKAMKMLGQYSYHNGNVRELISELQRAVGRAMLEEGHVLRAGYLSDELRMDVDSQIDTRINHPPESSVGAPTSESETLAAESQLDRETRELTVLKKNGFQIRPSEIELGYSHKSRTMSNHLRGICIKALCESDWNPVSASRRLAGAEDARTAAKLERKIRRFMQSIKKNVESGTESKLFNNLPSAYHPFLQKSIVQSRRWSSLLG